MNWQLAKTLSTVAVVFAALLLCMAGDGRADDCVPSGNDDPALAWACGWSWNPAHCCSGMCGAGLLGSGEWWDVFCIDAPSDLGEGACHVSDGWWVSNDYIYNDWAYDWACCDGRIFPGIRDCSEVQDFPPDTSIRLSSFTATPKAGKVVLEWSTESELDNLGFNLYRAESEDGEYTQINNSLIVANGSPDQSASYEFVDRGLRNRNTYWYILEDIDIYGTSTEHGPVSATPRLIYLLLK